MADVSAGKDFLTSLTEWEIKVAAYDVASGDRISEAVRVATIMDHAPDAVKSMLRVSPLEQRRSVDALKLWIRESSYATPGRSRCKLELCKGKKGKSKSTGNKGKGKGKGKDKSKHESNDGDNNKERDDWNNGQRQAKFQGYCAHFARSGATNVRIVELEWLNRKIVQWLAFKNLNRKPRMSKQQCRHGLVELVFYSHGCSKGPRQAHCLLTGVQTITFVIPIFQRVSIEKECRSDTERTCKATHYLTTRRSECGHTRTASKH